MSVTPFAFSVDFHDRYRAPRSVSQLEAELDQLRKQLAAQHEEGRRQGFAEAQAMLEAHRDTALLAATQATAAAIGSLAMRFSACEEELAVVGADLAYTIGEQLAAQVIERAPGAAVEQVIRDLLQRHRRMRALRIAVAPELAEPLQRCFEHPSGAANPDLALKIVADDTLAAGDARIDWSECTMVLDSASRAEAVRQKLAERNAA